MERILLVDDDRRLTGLVGDYLRREGFNVQAHHTGDGAVDVILAEQPAVVILDLMLPGMTGLEVCRRCRRQGYTGPVLMLTGRGDEVDQVVGLEVGADDYVPKPASPRLLLARIRALLRRHDTGRSVLQAREVGTFRVDPRTRGVRIGDDDLSLTTSEFDLLWILVERVGTPVSREDLVRKLRGIAYNGVDRSIDVRVSQLRRKLKDAGDRVQIKTVRSVGYQLVVPQD